MATIKISELTAAATLDGTEPLPIVQSGQTVKTTTQDTANLATTGLPYKIYTALLTSSSGTITAIQLQNTIGDGSGDGTNDIAWTNPSNGNLVGTMTAGDPFTTNKTWGISDSSPGSGGPYSVLFTATSLTAVRYALFKDNGTQPGTPNFSNLSIEIRVYP